MPYFSQISKKTLLFSLILTVSSLGNLFLLWLGISSTQKSIPKTIQCEPTNTAIDKENENRQPTSTAEILPHPPVFLEGRKIRFQSYSVKTIQGKKWILFKEIKGGGTIADLKVDAEAVRWF